MASRKAAKKLVKERRKAAEAVCWTLTMMMAVGALDIPMDERRWLSDTFDSWTELAVETGIMEP
jgi:hypothetical protein